MGSDLSEPVVSSETANRRMSTDMSGPLSDKPDGTIPNAQVTNTCIPTEERPNKTPIFISGVRDARTFPAWLRASCPGGLTAQLKDEKLMVVPSTANGFRAAASALRSLDGVRFWVSTPSRSRRTAVCGFWWRTWAGVCLRASSGRSSSPWAFMSRESRSCVPAVATRTPPRTSHPPLTSSYRWREGLRCRKCDRSPNSAAYECRWSRTWLRKALCNSSAASASDTRSVTADTRPGASRAGGSHLSGLCSIPREQPQCCGCGGNHTARTLCWFSSRVTEKGRPGLCSSKTLISPAQQLLALLTHLRTFFTSIQPSP